MSALRNCLDHFTLDDTTDWTLDRFWRVGT